MQETMYSVSEASKLLGIRSHVLRYWEEELQLPIQRNEIGHRYYTRCDIQVFLSINELKQKGYSLKEIKKLIPVFYDKTSEFDYEEKENGKIPKSFMEVLERIVRERLKEEASGEARYKRLDERIRNYQQSRREAAATIEQKQEKKGFGRKKEHLSWRYRNF